MPLPLALGLRKGDAVRLITGGVCVLEGGLLGRFIEGLSQDEKKSSPASAGVDFPSVGVAATTSVMTTSSGKLDRTLIVTFFSGELVHTLEHQQLPSSSTRPCILLPRLTCTLCSDLCWQELQSLHGTGSIS